MLISIIFARSSLEPNNKSGSMGVRERQRRVYIGSKRDTKKEKRAGRYIVYTMHASIYGDSTFI